jgi:general secretion pathway protein G
MISVLSQKTNRRGQAGFTLIEVLVVLVIIGIIVGIGASGIFGKSDRSKIDAAKIQIENFKSVLQLYELDMGRYPTTEEGLTALAQKPTDPDAASNWKGPYIKEVPKDPFKKDYKYELNESGTDDAPYYLYTEGTGKPETRVGILPPQG